MIIVVVKVVEGEGEFVVAYSDVLIEVEGFVDIVEVSSDFYIEKLLEE